MKHLFVVILTSFVFFSGKGQKVAIQVKADSIVSIKGTAARLSGLQLGTNERVYFVYKWRGMGKRIELLDMWFTVYLEEKRSRNGRKISVQKNN